MWVLAGDWVLAPRLIRRTAAPICHDNRAGIGGSPVSRQAVVPTVVLIDSNYKRVQAA
jgi:hypothetical protein